jgi:hypothetical protein
MYKFKILAYSTEMGATLDAKNKGELQAVHEKWHQ